jgi:hypothetical protein
MACACHGHILPGLYLSSFSKRVLPERMVLRRSRGCRHHVTPGDPGVQFKLGPPIRYVDSAEGNREGHVSP